MDIVTICMVVAAFLGGLLIGLLWPRAKAEAAHFEVIASQDVEAWFNKIVRARGNVPLPKEILSEEGRGDRRSPAPEPALEKTNTVLQVDDLVIGATSDHLAVGPADPVDPLKVTLSNDEVKNGQAGR